jgi:hypothetical protein
MPRQPRYEDFVPRFMQALFGPGDRVVLARLPPGGKWRDEPFARDDAIQALLELKDEANIYFRASAFDDSGGVKRATAHGWAQFSWISTTQGGAREGEPSRRWRTV